MNTAILHKELVLLLRQKRVFILAGVLYSLLVLAVAIRWGDVARVANRAEIGRGIFYLLIGLGYYLFFTFHAVQSSIRVMAQEKERGTSTLLRVSPLSPTSIIFQKLLTPLTIEWLLFLGTLPFLSLVFLLGGVPPMEFLLQLINLAVWLNTVILVGLFVGTKRHDTGRSIRTAWGFLFLIAFVLPLVMGQLVLWNLFGYFPLDSVWIDRLATLVGWIALVSPFDLVASVTAGGSVWGPVPGWIVHSILQVFLFLGAIRNWSKISGDIQVSMNRSEAKGVFGLFRWLRRGRREQGAFSVGWRAFRDLEEREVYRQWRPGKGVGLLVIPPVALAIALGGFPVLVGVTLLFGVAILVATAGFSSNSLKREIQRGTSVFLLTSPIDPTDIILGKWSFYMRQGFAVWSIGVLATLGAWLLTALGVSPFGEFEMASAPFWVLIAYASILCFIPFLSIYRLAENVRLYPQFLSYLVLLGLFCCAPLGLMVGSIMIGAGLVDVSPKALRNRPRARIPVVLLGWTCFLGCLSNVFLFPFAFSSYSLFFYPAVLAFDLTVLPFSAGLYLWILFSEKGSAWWRKHLLP